MKLLGAGMKDFLIIEKSDDLGGFFALVVFQAWRPESSSHALGTTRNTG